MTRKCRPDARLRAVLIPVLVLGAVGAALPAAAADADHLILSEIVTTANRFGSKFIEIVNPTAGEISLADVYLTNGTNNLNGAGYWRIVEDTVTSATTGGGTAGTFTGRFPDGAVIASGDTVTVSVTGSTGFLGAYGHLPDFEVYEDGAVPDAVPELVEAFPGSINAGALAGGTNTPTLNTSAGSVALFAWDGTTDLVGDVDYFCWGSNASYRVDKSGYAFGGSAYLDDTPVGSQHPIVAALVDRHSYMRNSADEDSEASGGNGVTGHDETSEDFTVSWADATPQDPATAPAAWLPTAPIFGGATTVPAAPAEGQDTAVNLQIASSSAVTTVEVSYTVDGGAAQTVLASDAGGGAWTATIPGQLEGAVVAWWAMADNAAGASAVFPSAAPRFTRTWTTAAPPPAHDDPHKLLITEVNAGVNFYPNYTGIQDLAMEFVEIHNPNDVAVDMSNYYLTDAISYVSGSQLYWQIASGLPSSYDLVGGGNYNDFTARFPDGFVIAANGTITVALAGSGPFYSVYGVQPDIELYEDAATPDDIPDMRPVFVVSETPREDSIYTPGRSAGSDGLPRGIPELEEYYGEPVILYHWVEGDALVTDIDIFMFGDEKTGNYRVSFDKTNVTYAGGTYRPDTPVAQQTWFNDLDTTGLKSYTRIAGDDADSLQVQTGSNGVDGRDETSENWPETFAVLDPTPGVYFAGGGSEGLVAELDVPAKTFLPELGEKFRIEFYGATGSETKVRIFNQHGRLVITLFDSRFDGPPSAILGYPSVRLWDGRDDTYQRVPAGMYIVHLSVVDKTTGEEETRTAPVVVATRLSK